MTDIELINKIRLAVPDSKDIERVTNICTKIPGKVGEYVCDSRRAVLANTQLNRITDLNKFFQRAKAFLDAGIKVDFKNTKIFSDIMSDKVKTFIDKEYNFIKSVDNFNDTEDFDV
ncbi:MAG: hypothetical protein HUJ61_06105 [Bacilli bacterium]|nr:hypothetical protein [Bacilli bacterium]